MWISALLLGLAAHSADSTPHGNGIVSASPNDALIHTHTDSVPNFGSPYTTASVTSGRWSDPAVWSSGYPPRQGEVVRITSGTRITYDEASDVRVHAVGVAGELVFSPAQDTRMRVTHLLVYRNGRLEIGRPDAPIPHGVTAEIVFNDEQLDTGAPGNPGRDPEQYGNGLLVWGTLAIHGFAKPPPFLRLARDPVAGETELLLEAPATGWRTGDEVVLPDSRQPTPQQLGRIDRLPYNEPGSRGVVADPQWETGRIERIDGPRLLLTAPLRYDHSGVDRRSSETDSAGATPLLPHVANLTRNVVIRSENGAGIRGHTICFRDARVQVANAAFVDLGRTTAAPLDNTRFAGDDRLVHIGRNQIARYPVHMHHLVDPDRVTGRGAEFELTGNVVRGARRWGMAVHASHFGLIAHNVILDLDGAGIVTEDGSETGNRFERNFVTGVRGSGLPADARRRGEGLGHEGAGFWFGSDNNIIVGNVAAGVRDGGFALFRSEQSLPFPSFVNLRGAVLGQRADGTVRTTRFAGNEVYGSAGAGVELWSTKECPLCRADDTVLEDTLVWNSHLGLVFDYHSEYYVVDGLVVQGSRPIADGSTGVVANNSRRARVSRAMIRDMAVGIEGGGSRNRELRLSDIAIRARTGVHILRGTSWGPRQPAVLRNVRISAPDGVGGEAARLIALGDQAYETRQPKRMLLRPILVYEFQGRPGNDFELFYPDQAPDAPAPYSTDPAVGCPGPGLTNRECLERHGIVVGGAVAPCDDRVAGVDGFACAITGPGATARTAP